jgi:hypothetical protein
MRDPIGTKYTIEWEHSWGTESWIVTRDSSHPDQGEITSETVLGKALLQSKTELNIEGKTNKYRIIEKQLPEYTNPLSTRLPFPAESLKNSRLTELLKTLNLDLFRKKIFQPLPKLESNDYLLASKWYSGPAELMSLTVLDFTSHSRTHVYQA